jgi:CheY-like chemotaxis protein
VVDDDPHIRDLLQVALGTFFNCQVEFAESAAEAVKKVEKRRFSFVVCDLMLGADSGLDLYYNMKRNPRRAAPFVLFSGHTSSLLPLERGNILAVEKTDLNGLLDAIEGMGIPPA